MTEIYARPQVAPTDSDELILLRDRKAYRVNFADLDQNRIAFSKTPPTDKALWWQLDEADLPVALWLLRPGGVWVSSQIYTESAFEFDVKKDWSFFRANPCAESIWIESFQASAIVTDLMSQSDYIDFQLALIDQQQQATPFYYLRLAGKAPGDTYRKSEYIGQAVAASSAMALSLNVRRNGQTKLRIVSMSVFLRKIYAASN